MDFCRTRDLDHVYKILTCPSIYLMMGDDFLPSVEDYRVPDNPDIVWLIAGGSALVGLFGLFPANRICWELHAALLPWASKHEKLEAAHDLVPWLAANTECKRIIASIPECNRQAVYYGVHAIGMHYVGKHEKAFLRYGRLQDLILLGREVESNEC
jgi:hypothetical protein